MAEPKGFSVWACGWLFFLAFNTFAEQLPIKIFTSADGLGSSFVSSMMRDSRGFLWFCTRDGLSRFDGSRFVTYQVGDQSAPPGIENILETRKGIYWIATTGGLYRYDPNAPVTQTNQNPDRPSLNAELVSDNRGMLLEDKAGQIWLASDDLYRLEEKDGQVSLQKFALNLPANPNITFNTTSMSEGQDGSLWMTTNWGLVRRLPDDRKIFYTDENSRTDIFISVIEDREGRIWAGRSSGIYVIKPESPAELGQSEDLALRRLTATAQPQKHTENPARLPEKPGEIFKYAELEGNSSAKYLYRTGDGHLWISTGDGVVEFDGQRFLRHSTKNGWIKGFGHMIEDTGGNLWLGWSTGLARLSRKGLTTFNTDDGLQSSTILTIGETVDGQVYTATTNYFLSQFNGTDFLTLRPPVPADARTAWTSDAIFQDSRGEWWILTNERLYHFAARKNLSALAGQPPLGIYDSRNGLKGDIIFHIFEDSRGNIWVSNRSGGSENFGLARWDPGTQKFYTFSTADGFPNGVTIMSFAEDKAGNIWVGAYEGEGLYRYSNGRFTEIKHPELPKGVISALLVDKLGRLWLGSTFKGLSRIDNPNATELSLVHFNVKTGLASNNVRSLVEDNFGNIYVGTARGIDRISPDGARLRHYSVRDGLAGDFVNAAFRDRQGVLWFGTPNGLSRLVPEPDKESDPPPVLLGGLRVAGEPRPVPELGSREISNLELNYTQNNLQIDYFGLDFNAGESLRYQYFLEGADKDWSVPVEHRTVTYANLGAGDYRFMVRAVKAGGTISQHPATISFKIMPPFWRRWWFIAGVILLIGLAVFSLDRYRLAKTRQVETALGKSIESETRFRTLAGTASDVIITIDEQSRIVFVNEAVEKTFGYTSTELAGEKLTILMPEDLRSSHDTGLQSYILTNRKNIFWTGVELTGRHKSGAEFPLELSIGEFELNGRRYFTGVARDISQRKEAEEALRKSREERFKELERVRSRIATDLHDDIGSSLSQISLYSELARQREREQGTAGDSLDMITNVADELVETMSDIVWAINPKKDHLQDLTQRMRRFAANVLTAKNIDLDFQAPASDQEIPLGANIRREVFLIFKETVNNVVKHSEATTTKINFLLQSNFLIITFEDNGRGFDPNSKLGENGHQDWKKFRGGNGLLNMRKRAMELGGAYEIKSDPGQGTIVILRVPLLQEEGSGQRVRDEG